VESDLLADSSGITWSAVEELGLGTIWDVDGRMVRVPDLDLVWWRRLTGSPQLPKNLSEEAREFVVNNCRAALVGLFITDFGGKWVSHPEATRLAENKLIQLRTASALGLRIPTTLISQSPAAVRDFCESLNFNVIVKPVAGAHNSPVMTGRVTPELIKGDDEIRVCPAIYQELIPGNRHLRVCCFGSQIRTAVLETERLDWRYPLDAVAQPFELDNGTVEKLQTMLNNLNLRMGIFDLKLTPQGEVVWLEINPQGQFLFLEGMCGIPLTTDFTDFLISEMA
jgi:glutathione synthase/RimK-type ligase-like ATP-grasp enzyme